jgi:hypothetical protein
MGSFAILAVAWEDEFGMWRRLSLHSPQSFCPPSLYITAVLYVLPQQSPLPPLLTHVPDMHPKKHPVVSMGPHAAPQKTVLSM